MIIRTATMEDLNNIAEVEALCFPKTEAASKEEFRERLEAYGNHFLLMFDGDKLVSFVDGFCTDEPTLTDEMYHDSSMHNEQGQWQMIFGVNTIPEYRRRGLASRLLKRMIEIAKEEGRKGLVLTCKKEKIHFYSSVGFELEGLSESDHGHAEWYQMRCVIK